MDYARFIRLRRPVWDDFERQLAASGKDAGLSHADLEEMALRYRQVLHDHALADARYPGTAAAQRLRVLALQGTHRLIRDRGEGGGLLSFFTRTFPRAFRAQLGLLGVTTALFLFATFWGLAVAVNRPALGLAFLGPEAIRGLEEGRMWTESLVSTVPPSVSSSGIATNNISVALTAWSGGILAGVVPLYTVLLNGVMLGSIVGITMRYSMAGELLEFVSAHGPLEITLILVCAAAGLSIGRALVAAGDRPRSLALRDAGRNALTVLLGCIPWFVVLALVEVLISPSPNLPAALKVVLGLSLEILFLVLAVQPFSRKAQESS
jgi:uncharacterized membrane protein SpoIIM required for sporulation